MPKKSGSGLWRRTGIALVCLGGVAHTGTATSVTYEGVAGQRWEGPGVAVEVEMDQGGQVSAQTTPAALVFFGGLAGAPFALLNPGIALTLPFFIVLGPPTQASFNADAEGVIKALRAAPLPERVIDSLRSQWSPPSPVSGPVLQLRMRISGYGLVTRSGRPLDAFKVDEKLCLVAEAQLELETEGSPVRVESLSIGLSNRSPDAPPPFCSSLGRLGANDGRLLRESIAELGEVLAAMTLNRVEAAK